MATRSADFTKSNGTAWTATDFLSPSGTFTLNNLNTATTITQDVQSNEGRMAITTPGSGTPGFRRCLADPANFQPTDVYLKVDFRYVTTAPGGDFIPCLMARQPTSNTVVTHYYTTIGTDGAGKFEVRIVRVNAGTYTEIASVNLFNDNTVGLAADTDYTLEFWVWNTTATRSNSTSGTVAVIAVRITKSGSTPVPMPRPSSFNHGTTTSAHNTSGSDRSTAVIYSDGDVTNALTAAGRVGILHQWLTLSKTIDIRWDDFLADDAQGVLQWIAPTGHANSNAFGTPTTSSTVDRSITGIASGAALGAPTLSSTVSIIPSSIDTQGALGAPTVTPGEVSISPSSIASGGAFGAPSVDGETAATQDIAPTGIGTSEAIGTHSVSPGAVSIVLSSIPSGETFGTPNASPGAVDCSITGIGSSEALGEPSFTLVAFITPSGIATTSVIGDVVTSTQYSIQATGIESTTAIGDSTLSSTNNISVNGIASQEAFGDVTLEVPGAIFPTSVDPESAIGQPTVAPGAVSIAVDGISSQEAFGVPTLNATVNITVSSIENQQQFGILAISSTINIQLQGIDSGIQFGTPTFTAGGIAVSPSGIASTLLIGAPAVGVVSIIVPVSIVNANAFGTLLTQMRVRRKRSASMQIETVNNNSIAISPRDPEPVNSTSFDISYKR